ncbi:periaxin [Ambystoma mexicanum]|uniref:periaxin n=1 Tax=Ambystoma mexicanum TaxID=8296 RepID=UPI0037E893DE
MDSKNTMTEEEVKKYEVVQIVMETEAEAGVSGISVAGGGKSGLFIKDVLKDSPAAKSLSLKEGDQLLSAKVYFDNVKYEDALQILQCAEPYKISFCLKRNVNSADVTVSPGTGSVEVKGPKAKMPKMTVKNLTPVKKAKSHVKVSGEGSLGEAEEVDGEISAGKIDIAPVDVEFSLPRFGRFRKAKGQPATEAAGESPDLKVKRSSSDAKGMKLKLPRMRVKEAAAMESLALETHGSDGKKAASLPGAKVDSKGLDAEGKVKVKAPRFGISLSKSKKVSVSKADVEVKEDIKCKAPQVELDISLPTGKTDAKAEGLDVSSKGEGFQVKGSAFGSLSQIPDVEIKTPRLVAKVEVGGESPESKLRMPKVGLSLPGLEGEVEGSGVTIEGLEEKPKIGIKLPSVELAAPTVDMELSMPKLKGGVDARVGDVEPKDVSTKGEGFQIQMPKFGVSGKIPKVELDVSRDRDASDIEVGTAEGKFKMPEMKTPKIGISLPKDKSEGEMTVSVTKAKIDADIPDGKFNTGMKMPSLDISAPKLDVDITLPKGKLEVDSSQGHVGQPSEPTIDIPDVTIKMPKISLPKFGAKVKESHLDTESSKVQGEVKLAKGGKVEAECPDIKAKGHKIKMPSFGLSLSKEKHDVSAPPVEMKTKEPEVAAEGKVRFPSIKMPSIDISAPEIPDIEMPRAKLEVSGHAGGGEWKSNDSQCTDGSEIKFKMPSVSLPKFHTSAELEGHQTDVHVSLPKIGAIIKTPKLDPGLKDSDLEMNAGKMSIPKVDISVPKIKSVEIDLPSPKAEVDLATGQPKTGTKPPKVDVPLKSHGLEMERSESKISFPSVKMPSLSIDMPKVDLAVQEKAEMADHGIAEPDTKWKMPAVSLPTFRGQEKDVDIELDVASPTFSVNLKAPHDGAAAKGADFTGIGGGITLPKVGLSFGEGKHAQEGEVELGGPGLKVKGDKKLPEVKPAHDELSLETKLKLPSVKLPSLEISSPKLPDVDIDAELPKGTVGTSEQADLALDVSGETEGKWKSHKFSLPKFGMSGKSKKGEGHMKAPHAELEADSPDVTAKGSRLKMPKFGISFPKAKLDLESSVDVSQPSPKADIKPPKGQIDISGSKEELGHSEGMIMLPAVKLPQVDLDIHLGKSDDHVAGEAELHSAGDIRAPSISIDVPDVQLEMPKFSLPNVGVKSIEGEVDMDLESSKAAAKAKAGVSADIPHGGIEVSGTDGKLKGKEGKMKMPKFKMPSFNMSKKEVDISGGKVEGAVTAPEINVKLKKGKVDVQESEQDIDSPEGKGKISFMKMPKFKMTSPKTKAQGSDLKLQADLDSKGFEDDLHGPDFHMKMPKISLPKFGSKEGTAELAADIALPEATGGRGSGEINVKASHLKMPSLEISAPSIKSDVELSMPKSAMEVSGGDMEEYKGNLKMPSLNISAPSVDLDLSLPKPKVGTLLEREGKGEVDLQRSDIKMHIPNVELPTFGLPDLRGRGLGTDETGKEAELHLLPGKKEKALTIALKGQKIRLDSEGNEGELEDETATLKGSKIRMPTLDISMPKLRTAEEDIPFADANFGTEGFEIRGDDVNGKFTLPSVELPKIPTPHIKAPELELDISLGKDENVSVHPELGKTSFQMKVPDVELSGPDVEGTDFKFKMPKMKMPKFGGSGSEVKGYEGEQNEGAIKGVKIKMPKLQLGSLKGKTEDNEGGVESGVEGGVKIKGVATNLKSQDLDTHGGKFKFKVPTVGISMGGGETKEQDIDMQPLHPTEEEGEMKMRMPKLTLPDIGFTDGEGKVIDGHPGADFKANAKLKSPKTQSPKTAGIGDLEVDLGLSDMKMPHVKVPSIGISGWRGKSDDDMNISLGNKADFHAEEMEGMRSHFKMPDVEFSGPKIKAHGEYEVDSAMGVHSTSKEKGSVPSPTKVKVDKKDSDAGEDDDTGKRYQVKLPKFGISLPSVGLEGESDVSEPKVKTEAKIPDVKGHRGIDLKPGSAEHETEKQEVKGKMPKVKKAVFVMVKSKEKGSEASSGLLESDVDSKTGTLEIEAPSTDVKIKLPKIKKKPSFGRSHSKQKGADVNGDFESPTKEDGDSKGSKMKFPRLGFSNSKTDSLDVNVNGSPRSGTSTHLNGDHELSLENGSQDSRVKLGKLKFPKLEFSSPYKTKEQDSEMNLKLVKTEEPALKDEGHGSAFAAIKAAKFKPPKMSFSGFKKKTDRNEDVDGSTNIVASSARTEMASMEKEGESEAKSSKAKISLGFFSSKSRGEYIVDHSGGTSQPETSQVATYEVAEGDSKEKVARFKFPKISLSPKSQGMLEMTPEQETADEEESSGFKISLPQVGFNTYQEHTSEEHIITEEGGSILRVTQTKRVKTETGPETSTVI